jgi:hypothetical protein
VDTLNVAVTFRFWVITTVQVGIFPPHAPVHRTNVEPGEGVAVNVTFIWNANPAVHAVPQLIPDGEDTTVPPPLPSLVIVSWRLAHWPESLVDAIAAPGV